MSIIRRWTLYNLFVTINAVHVGHLQQKSAQKKTTTSASHDDQALSRLPCQTGTFHVASGYPTPEDSESTENQEGPSGCSESTIAKSSGDTPLMSAKDIAEESQKARDALNKLTEAVQHPEQAIWKHADAVRDWTQSPTKILGQNGPSPGARAAQGMESMNNGILGAMEYLNSLLPSFIQRTERSIAGKATMQKDPDDEAAAAQDLQALNSLRRQEAMSDGVSADEGIPDTLEERVEAVNRASLDSAVFPVQRTEEKTEEGEGEPIPKPEEATEAN